MEAVVGSVTPQEQSLLEPWKRTSAFYLQAFNSGEHVAAFQKAPLHTVPISTARPNPGFAFPGSLKPLSVPSLPLPGIPD